jgi:hypothetical protein
LLVIARSVSDEAISIYRESDKSLHRRGRGETQRKPETRGRLGFCKSGVIYHRDTEDTE